MCPEDIYTEGLVSRMKVIESLLGILQLEQVLRSLALP